MALTVVTRPELIKRSPDTAIWDLNATAKTTSSDGSYSGDLARANKMLPCHYYNNVLLSNGNDSSGGFRTKTENLG